MSDPFIGQIYLVGYSFAQRGFSLCQGQLMPISQNSALFSLIGTTYGGDGRSTFGLPDLRGRSPIGQGQGPGLDDYRIGATGGSESNMLSIAQMPAHNHSATLNAENAAASVSAPAGNLLGQSNIYAPPGRGANQAMSTEAITVGNAGGNAPVNNMQPFLVMNYEIALQGVFPSRQ